MWKKREKIIINKKMYTVVRVYEKQKNSQIYIVSNKKQLYTIEKFDEYEVYQKIIDDYAFLKELHIPMPELIDADNQQKIILKEYLSGPLAANEIVTGKEVTYYFEQMKEMALLVEARGRCLNYFPYHYVDHNHILYYVHYECFPLEEKRSFDFISHLYWIDGASLIQFMKSYNDC